MKQEKTTKQIAFETIFVLSLFAIAYFADAIWDAIFN